MTSHAWTRRVALALCLSSGPAAAEAPPAQGAPRASPPAEEKSSYASLRKEADRLLNDDKHSLKVYARAVAAYERALAAAPTKKERAQVQARIAEAYFRQGDLASPVSKRQSLYKKGEAEAQKGLDLDPRCADCVFWRVSNLGRWGETRGVLKSLFLLDDIRSGYEKVVELDPDNIDAQLALGIIHQRLPGFAGGDNDKARAVFEKVLKKNPNHTRAMLDLAVLLEDEGEEEKAIALARKVMNHKRPARPGHWRKFDRPRARELLKEWE